MDQASSQLEYRVWANPEDLVSRIKLARFYLEHQRPDLARPQVEHVRRRNPAHAEARRLEAAIAAMPEPTE
jgi:hypothetical protein